MFVITIFPFYFSSRIYNFTIWNYKLHHKKLNLTKELKNSQEEVKIRNNELIIFFYEE